MRIAVLVFVAWSLAFQNQGDVIVPRPVKPSNLTVRLDLVGRMPSNGNPTSPVVAGEVLLLVDQTGYIYRWDGMRALEVLSPSTAPAGITLVDVLKEQILSVAANEEGSKAYIVFTSSTVPRDVPRRTSPRPSADVWLVLYEYDFNGVSLSNAKPIGALQVRSDGHTGGGLAVLDDGSVLFATGDQGDSYEDGRSLPQEAANHVGKLLRIRPADGSMVVVGLGMRFSQRLAVYEQDGESRLEFIDPGGSIAEELNSVRVADLTGNQPVLNFGWGRHADRKAREGTFYIDTTGKSVGAAPNPESGFVGPVAEFGREGAAAFAGSGPVSSLRSFSRITSLFGDLVSGSVYAITSPTLRIEQDVFRVALVDSRLQAVTVMGLTGGTRGDLRFFNFPDGTAGVLLEGTGEFYRLTELLPK